MLTASITAADTFEEVAGTALIAAATLRLHTLSAGTLPSAPSLQAARFARAQIIKNNIDSKTGLVSPVTDPLKFSVQADKGITSPEAQAFVLMLESAWRDAALTA